MKKLLRYLLILVILIVVVVVVAFFLAKKYEPEVRSIVLYELNRHLDVEVKVDDINFSLLQRFPYASLRFSEVVIPEVRTDGEVDTLIYIKDLYLQIGLFDFFRKNYRITEAEINHGFFRMTQYADGTDNYHFWKTTADTASANAALSLTNIEINNFEYQLRSGDQLELLTFIEEGEANGNFGSEKYDISSDSRIRLKYVISEGDTLFTDQLINGKVEVNIDQVARRYTFHGNDVGLGNENISIEGRYDFAEATPTWHLDLKADDAKIENLVGLMPRSLQKQTKSYKARGKTNVRLVLNTNANGDLDLDVLFEKTRGHFQHQVAQGTAKISDASGSLQIRSGITSLYLDGVKASIGPGELKAFGKIIDFNAPAFDLNLEGSMDLEEFKNFLSIPLVEKLGGKLRMNGRLHGKLPKSNSSETIALLKGIDFVGDIVLSDGVFKLLNQGQVFEKINGNIDLRNNALIVNNATAIVNGSAFEISGNIDNALPYISSQGQKLHIKANFASESLDFNKIWTSESTKRDTTYNFQLPKNVSFDLSLDVGKINFRRFEADAVQGRAQYQNGLLTLNPFSFRTASGTVRSNMSIQRVNEKLYTAKAKAVLENIAVDQLFYQFEDFGQEVVRSTHIEGRTQAAITFSGNFGQDLTFDMKSIEAQIDVVIANGKLKKLETLQGIADYLKESALWRSLIKVDEFERKLQVVAFDTLKNSIRIDNGVVTIPAMTVGSSAMTINISGTHTFTHDIDYSLNFKLSDLLRTGKKQNEDFGYVVEDESGLRLFMQMTGTAENPIFSLDKDAARDKRKQELANEKNVMKSILKEEFGLFKSDTTLQGVPKTEPKKATKFDVEWDEFGKDSTQTEKKKRGTRGLFNKEKDDYDGLGGDDDL